MFSSTCLLQISSLLLFSCSVLAHPIISHHQIPDFIARLLQQLQQLGPCRSAGHVNGCCDSGLDPATACRVPKVQGGYCYCDIQCHRYDDCCSDIHMINCLPPPTTPPPMISPPTMPPPMTPPPTTPPPTTPLPTTPPPTTPSPTTPPPTTFSPTTPPPTTPPPTTPPPMTPPPTTPPPPTCASGGYTGCCMRGLSNLCEVTNAVPTTPPPTTPPPPTCVSGGHTGCCMQGLGNLCNDTNAGMRCYCDQECHERDDCCSDIGNSCPAPTTPPPTCASGGYTECCMRDQDSLCRVTNAGMTCYCDQGCHERGECCSDIETIGCYANNSCLNNNLNTSCCNRSNDIACRVTLSSSTSCWCDSRCKMSNNDCCNGFMQFCPSSTPTSSTANLRLHQLIRQLKTKLARQMTHVRPLEWSSDERALQQYERPQEFRPNYEDSLLQQYERPREFRPNYPKLQNGERAAALWRRYNVARIQNYQLSRKLQELQQRIQNRERMASLFRRYGAGRAAEMYVADED